MGKSNPGGPQSTAWHVRDYSSVGRTGKYWDMRALQEAWPLHGRPSLTSRGKVVLGV